MLVERKPNATKSNPFDVEERPKKKAPAKGKVRPRIKRRVVKPKQMK